MKSYDDAPFWAITGIGYGRGFTADEAVENYRAIQRRNFPHMSSDDLDECWGYVWRAPDGTTGFHADSKVWWELSDDSNVEADPSQRVQPIGRVPAWATSND